jgi:hypothetical protein
MVCKLAESAGRALGVDKGVIKGDLVICPNRGAMVIEIAVRLSGGDFSASLVPEALGINYIKTAIEISLGRDPDFFELNPKKRKTVANRYFFPPVGKLEEIQGLKWLESLPECVKVEIYPKIGDELPVIDGHGKRAGVFVLVGEDRHQLEELIEDVYARVKFRVNGVWVSLKPCAENTLN